MISTYDKWIRRAQEISCKYIIIMFDTIDKEEYPVYYGGKDVNHKIKQLTLSEGKQSLIDIIKI